MTEQQWLKIYKETIHSLYGYIAKRTGGNQALTEDIVQESYLRAINSWKRKKSPDSPLAWLNRVARNILIDYLRKKKWDIKADLEIHLDKSIETSENQIKSLETFMAISSLGQKKASVLEAFYYEGKSVRDIANEMTISERAVEGHLRRARQYLKSLLPQPNQNGGKNE